MREKERGKIVKMIEYREREREKERENGQCEQIACTQYFRSTVDALLTVRKCKIESLCGCVGECVRVCVGGWVCICWIFVRKSCV